MSGIGEEIRERADVLSEELLSILLELSEDERGFKGSGADQTLREALATVSSFRGKPQLDDSAVEELAHARALLGKALTMIASETSRESVSDLADFLDKLRARSIELMVERDRHGTGRKAEPRLVDDVVLSLGTPALVKGVAISVPRLFVEGGEKRRTALAKTDDDDDDDDDDEDEDEAPISERRARSRNGDEGERAQIEALARDAMEDLSSFSTLRVLSDDEPWKYGHAFERRLLANLDCLVSLARPVRSGAAELDLAEALFAYASEWIVPDRGRAFGFALTLCCIDSDSALLWVTMALRRAAYQTLPAYVDAFVLGSNPSIPTKLIGLLSDDVSREIVIVALEASLRRRIFNAGRMIPLSAHPDVEVAALATRCFAFAPQPLAQTGLSELSLASHPLVRVSAAVTMLEIGMAAQALQVLRDFIDETVGRGTVEAAGLERKALRVALRALAVNADPNDADRVWVTARTLRSYREVGFFGHVAHVPLLFATLDELSQADVSVELVLAGTVELLERVAGAIHRITGVNPPSFGSSRYDLEGFKQLWAEHGPDVQAVAMREGRVRFGRPWAKKRSVDELGDPETRQGDRRLLADELTLASDGQLRFDVDGWITDQRAFLKMVQEAWA